MKTFPYALAALAIAACGLMAQSPSMSCRDNGGDSPRFCEVRETTIGALGTLNVDGRQNGGISIRGANRADILVRSMVQARGSSEADARNTGAQVIVHTSAGSVQADGPAGRDWSVSYEICVPLNTNLNLKTNNGAVSVPGTESSIGFHAVNGGISLKNVNGYIHGDTVNGGVSVALANTRFTGQGIDISTNNGGVSMKVPDHLSALLDVSTVNGGMSVRLPNALQMQRSDRHQLNLTLGSGGPLIRVRTHNGGVSIAGLGGAA